MKKNVLIVGCGSIGERHLRCFQKTGRTEVFACETNPGLLAKVCKDYSVTGFAELNAALSGPKFDGIVICTPAQSHISIASAGIRHGAALLIEKPLSTKLDGVNELKKEIEQAAKFVAVAYVYHVRPSVSQAREYLKSGALGNALQISVVSGQHFPTYRPAYREIYFNDHKTGGGTIQDALTHMANLVEWLAGPTTRVFCEASHQALEGVSIEDTVCVTAKNGNVLVSYTMNQFQRPNETTIQVHCQRGSLKIEIHEQRWGVFPVGVDKWDYRAAPTSQSDDVFVAQANAFLDGIDGKPTPLCTLAEAVQTLRFNLAALESARTGKAVSISP